MLRPGRARDPACCDRRGGRAPPQADAFSNGFLHAARAASTARAHNLQQQLRRFVVDRWPVALRAVARAVIAARVWRFVLHVRAQRWWQHRAVAAQRMHLWQSLNSPRVRREEAAARAFSRAPVDLRCARATTLWTALPRAVAAWARPAVVRVRRFQDSVLHATDACVLRNGVVVRTRATMRALARRSRARTAWKHALLLPLHVELIGAMEARRHRVERRGAILFQNAWRAHVARVLVASTQLAKRVEEMCMVRAPLLPVPRGL